MVYWSSVLYLRLLVLVRSFERFSLRLNTGRIIKKEIVVPVGFSTHLLQITIIINNADEFEPAFSFQMSADCHVRVRVFEYSSTSMLLVD